MTFSLGVRILALSLASLALFAAPKPKAKSAKPKVVRETKLMLRSSSVLVLDQATGQTLVDKHSSAVVPIASLTKLMTAMVLLDAHLDPRESISITTDDKDELRHSHSRLPVGTHLLRQEALMLALVASENRAAHALGRTFPGGLTAFVAGMNRKALTLGLSGTHFEDPTGLSANNVATARDLALILNAACAYPEIRDFSTRPEASIQAGRRAIAFPNTNALVRNPRWSIGLSKTGYIEEAGRCLAMQVQMANRTVLVVLLDSWGKYSRLGDAARIKQWLEARLAGRG